MSFCTAHPWTSWVVILFDSQSHIGNNSWTPNLLEFPNISKRDVSQSCRSHYSLGPPYVYSPSCVNWSQFCRSLELYSSLSMTFLVKPTVVNVLWCLPNSFSMVWQFLNKSEETYPHINVISQSSKTPYYFRTRFTVVCKIMVKNWTTKFPPCNCNNVAAVCKTMTLSSWPHWVEKKNDSAMFNKYMYLTASQAVIQEAQRHIDGCTFQDSYEEFPRIYHDTINLFNKQFPLPIEVVCVVSWLIDATL